jgi:protein-S-isoprenylcysteine O-methyltransferase Ste14
MYLALGISYAGLALMMDSLWGLLLLIPVVLVVNFYVIAREEKYLTWEFGDEYRSYMSKVRRWI